MRGKTGVLRAGKWRYAAGFALLAIVASGAGAMVTPAAAQQETVSFAIAAGPLSSALNTLASQSGIQIGFDSAIVAGKTSGGLKGAYTPDQALRRLLSGTQISYSFTDARTVVLNDDAATITTGAVEGGAQGEVELAPIIVSGEKMPRSLFDTYVSAGVVTAEELDAYTVKTLDQALNRLGNVRSFDSGTGNSSFVIRGLNSDGVTQPSRAAPVISVLVDGAEQGVEANRRGTRGIWDVEQVEVLRGPQSTLQGRNSLAGSVLIKTKDPTWTPEVAYETMGGNNDFWSGAFALSAPLIKDQLAFRVSGQVWRSTKDITYTDPSIASLGEDEFEEFRGKLLFTPEALPGFTGLFTVSRTHDKPGWGLVTGPDFFDRTFDDVTATSAEFRDTYVNRYIADLTYEISPSLTLKSVTSLADTDVTITSPAGYSIIRDDVRDGTDLSHDMRLIYESEDSPFSGVFGIFAGSFKTDLDSSIQTTLLAPLGVPLIDVQVLDAKNRTNSIAAYADTRYKFADKWTLMAGGRVLRDKVSAKYEGYALDLEQTMLTGFPVFGSLDEDNSVSNTVVLPKFGLAFDFADNQTIGATVSRGYRAGFSEAVAGTTDINTVDPEYLWSYELAYRSKWMDDRLQLNANVFYYDYRNQQILTFNPAFPGQTSRQTAPSLTPMARRSRRAIRRMPIWNCFHRSAFSRRGSMKA